MPGENCAILGCGSRRRTKGIGIWKRPAPKDEAHRKWRNEWLQHIARSRHVDRHFKELLAKDRMFTCEKHFEPEDIEIFHSKKMTKKRPRFGAIPKVNMRRKSHATPKPQPRARRSRPVIVHVEETQQTNQHCYKGLLDFSQRLARIKSLTQWNTKTLEDKVVLKKMADVSLPNISL